MASSVVGTKSTSATSSERKDTVMWIASSANVLLAIGSLVWCGGAYLAHSHFLLPALVMFVLTATAYGLGQAEEKLDASNVTASTIIYVAIAALDVVYLATLTMALWALYGL